MRRSRSPISPVLVCTTPARGKRPKLNTPVRCSFMEGQQRSGARGHKGDITDVFGSSSVIVVGIRSKNKDEGVNNDLLSRHS